MYFKDCSEFVSFFKSVSFSYESALLKQIVKPKFKALGLFNSKTSTELYKSNSIRYMVFIKQTF